jgi:hypothetical protein
MPAQHAVAARAEAAIVPPADHVSAIQLVEVPTHWPPADSPQSRGPAAASAHQGGGPDQDGGPDQGRGHLVDPVDEGQAWPRQFAVLLAEVLTGVRPVRQLLPWLSERGSVQLHRLLPRFADGHRPHVTRVLTTRPAQDVIEMTLVVSIGPRTRALAVRLERIDQAQRPAWSEKLTTQAARPRSASMSAQWRCTDIEAA